LGRAVLRGGKAVNGTLTATGRCQWRIDRLGFIDKGAAGSAVLRGR
jgi:hypothetical protein